MLDNALQKSYKERFSTIRMLEKQALETDKDASALSLRDLKEKGFFEYQDKTYCVRDISRYEESSEDFKTRKGYFIHEMTCFCIETGETVYFEWEFDDELEISITLDRFSFRNLTDDTGEAIDEDDLDQIVDDKDAVIVNNEKFWYEDDWPAVFERGGSSENVYMYEFENETATRFLTIEEWQGSGRDEYRIYTSEPVPAGSIGIVSKGGH